MIARIKKNDTVEILSGKDKGHQGQVIEILPKKGKVMVKGLNIITRHVKPRRQGEVGSIKKMESYLSLARVLPVCSACKKACRVVSKQLEGGKKARACNHCNEII